MLRHSNENIKDYQIVGNVRVLLGSQGEVLATPHYYPYGQVFATGQAVPDPEGRYRYSGKEWEAQFGRYVLHIDDDDENLYLVLTESKK